MSSLCSNSSNSNPLLSSDSSEDGEYERITQEALDACDALQERARQRRNNAEAGRARRRRKYIERNQEEGYERLYIDYFSDQPTYPDDFFRRRFRMSKEVFKRIVETLGNGMEYFQQRPDARGRPSISALQKCTSVIRMLAYGTAVDAYDQYIRISGGTARHCLEHFIDGIITFFGDEYLRRPTAADIQRLLSVGESRGFPRMLGSIDCMHWGWKNCPTAWKGQYAREDHGHPTIILEVVASYDLWFWHAFFGVSGTTNDINVLERSPIFDEVLNGRAPNVNFTVNGSQYKMGYYLADGIYPPCVTFVQSIRLPQGNEAKLFSQHQESVRKDVERALGVLQSRFAIVRQPALSWDFGKLGRIMRACIILHNMIVEDERDSYIHHGYEIPQFGEGASGENTSVDNQDWSNDRPEIMNNPIITRRDQIRDRTIHHMLKEDLKKHIWNRYGNN